MKIITIESKDCGNFTFPCLEVAQVCGNIRVLTGRIACADGSVHNEFFSIPRGVVSRYESLADYAFRNHIHVSAFYPPQSSNDGSAYMVVRSRSGKKSHVIMGWTMSECFSKLVGFVGSSEFEKFL